MSFAPRRRKNYIIWKGGRAYYRRNIPIKYRPLFAGKTAWVIALKGHGDAALEAEAAAYAHAHNQELADHDELGEEGLKAFIEAVVAYDTDPTAFASPEVERHGLWIDGENVNDDEFCLFVDERGRTVIEVAGRVMSMREHDARQLLASAKVGLNAAVSPEDRELAELRAFKGQRDLESAIKADDDVSLISLLPRWKAFKKQAPMTWQKHEQYVREFVHIHGDLRLSEVTKRHVVEYVEHAMTLTHKGAPLSPTSISKRLDSVRAILGFAVSRSLIDHNPASGVKPPKDTRPKTSRSWKSFTSAELMKLVEVSTELWTSRKVRTAIGRGADLITALQCLIWTGARPEEICQLRRTDVDMLRRSIRITNDETEDVARGKVTKNDHSIREVPIHPRLLPILELHLNSHNHALVFPTFEPQVRPADLREAERTGQPIEMRGRYMHPISREWTDNLRAKVVGSDTRKVLYSLRHSWSAESRKAGMPEYVRNALMGHAADNPHAEKYGNDADWLEEKRRYLEVMNCLPVGLASV